MPAEIDQTVQPVQAAGARTSESRLAPNDGDDFDAPHQSPKTAHVLGLLFGAAAIVSYLGAYALGGALVKAEMIAKWQPGHDPRPRWLIMTFIVTTALFALLGGVARVLSKRQMRRIEAMEAE